jgi:drug/metabolite transporter (DMT)-like permease
VNYTPQAVSRPKVSAHTLGMSSLLLTVVAWSFGPTLSAQATTYPLVSVFVRMFGALAMQWIVTLVIGKPPTTALLRTTFLPGVLFGLNNILFFFALQHANVANVGLLTSLQPVVVLLLAKPLFNEKVSAFDIACTAVAIFGTGIAVFGGNAGTTTRPTTLLGTVLAVLSMFAFCGYFLVAKRQNSHATVAPPHPLTYMTGIIAGAATVSVPFLVFSGHAGDLANITRPQISALALIILVPTAGHVALTFTHRHIDAKLSSLVLLIQPMSSALVAWWILHQPVVPAQAIGALIVMASIAAVTIRQRSIRESALDDAVSANADLPAPTLVAGD